jgi:pyruvate dehydrogenase E2 component (dihydrolipoamide acetyltransferase)
MAAESGLDLNTLSGRGPHGRIQRADVVAAEQRMKQAQEVQPATAAVHMMAALVKENLKPDGIPALQIPLPEARRKEVVPLVGARKIIAQRMTYSAATAPHITLSLHVAMSEATRLRTCLLKKIEQSTGQRLSITAILARAVAAVLPHHPFLNASLNGDEIICWEDVHLGIATSLNDYLIVPVIRHAQEKNLEQLVTALADLVERARSRRLSPAEMSGSTFTISNLGMFGIESFTAIINPPESAILAAGKIVERQATEEDGLALKPMMNLTLSADHRVIDGVAAAGFLAELKATLENPYLLL